MRAVIAAQKEIQSPVVAATQRLDSLDAFRGLVILTMVFVNYLAGVHGIPSWAKHAKQGVDAFTFVDVVFPGFLFIVGVAIPFALHKRLQRGESKTGLIGKIFTRSAVLIFFGVITVNKGNFSPDATGMSRELWFLLALVCMIVLWGGFPGENLPKRKKFFLALRIAAGLLLIYLLAIFRGKSADGQIAWLQTSWWGILGMIGWAYLECALIYLLFRGNSTALMGALLFMIALFIGDKHGALDWLGPVHNWINIGGVFGSTAADVMIGILVGNCFVGSPALAPHLHRARFILIFGVALLAAGFVLRPLHGINKIDATESYALVTGGICALCFLFVYFVMDVCEKKSWAKFLIPVGQNALLAYLLPGILANFFTAILAQFTPVLRADNFLYVLNEGWVGTINCAVLTALILTLTAGLTKRQFVLKL